MNRTEKQREVETLGDSVGRAESAFLLDFEGLDVAQATDLRAQLRHKEGRLRVVKNRLALRAFADKPLGQIDEAFVGQTMVAYPVGEDIVGIAKVLRDFATEHEVPRFKAGLLDGAEITVEEFESLADMPSREELIARLLYLMQYPVQGLVNALNGVTRNFVVVLEQIRAQRQDE